MYNGEAKRPIFVESIKVETIWGGNNISKARGYDKGYGTWWEISANKKSANVIKNYETDKNFYEFIKEDESSILGEGYTLHEMLRLGYLDTVDSLSIQVHPDDEYAIKNSDDFGKKESWYIIDAKPGAKLVAGTTTDDTDVIKEAFENGTLEKYLKRWEVSKGDFITIPEGMIHALGRDILALEIGTNSDTTYRFYDYNRVDKNGKKRDLHVKESFDVVDFSKQPEFVKNEEKSRRLIESDEYVIDELYLENDMDILLDKHFCIVSNIGEDCIIEWNGEKILLQKYENVFVPYASKKITIEKGAHILLSQPGKEI
ncbi:class I mannose-6-phosphate isomerase [Peptacetobacter sp.]|uniref:class I mannose-6-phosphate isomerase n=1 Tax=Peptacetobacter sp. TaxID=2991975 RepID=UPI002E78925B|nr:class I mannose-6-phosphate isomerase [Peptacetobacter sp.]MEE0451396.1 class I mannose-6-phosphate isomerase [Peptacetobacter sp.]